MQLLRSEVEKILYLDGLRGVAAFLVLLDHLILSLMPAVITFNPKEIHSSNDMSLGLLPIGVLWNGNFAVCVFFILSGFVLSDFCQSTMISFPAQVFRRYLRLALPMLLTSTFAWLLLHFKLFNNYEVAINVTHSGWLTMWYRFDANFLKMVKESVYTAFLAGRADYNCNLWTMKIELIGSVFIFMLNALFNTKRLRLTIILVFVFIWHEDLAYYSMFAMGALFFDFNQKIKNELIKMFRSNKKREIISLIGFLFGLYLGSKPALPSNIISPWHNWLSHNPNELIWHTYGAIVTMFFILQSQILQDVFSKAIPVYLGRISFALYLIHIPIICSLTTWIMLVTQDMPYLISALLSGTISIGVIIFLSNLIYKHAELRTISISRTAGKSFDSWFRTSKPNCNTGLKT